MLVTNQAMPEFKTDTAINPADFEEIYRAFRKDVANYTKFRLGDPLDAQDASQETWLGVVKSLGRYQERGRLRSLIMRIATNVCNEAQSRQKSRATTHEAYFAQSPRYTAEGSAESYALAIIGDEEAMRVWAQVEEAMNPDDRQILDLYEKEGLSCGEISQLWGEKYRTTTGRVFRARRARAALAGRLYHQSGLALVY